MLSPNVRKTLGSESAEDWVAKVTEIVRLYRGTSPNPLARRINLGEALARMRDLGLEEGDATRWLTQRGRMARPALR